MMKDEHDEPVHGSRVDADWQGWAGCSVIQLWN